MGEADTVVGKCNPMFKLWRKENHSIYDVMFEYTYIFSYNICII